MNIGPTEAAAALVDIESIARKVKQSSWYRLSSTVIMLWGFLVALGYVAAHFAPHALAVIWLTINGVGIVVTAGLKLHMARTRGQNFDPRSLVAILLFLCFGLLWSRLLGGFGHAKATRSGRRCSCSAMRSRGCGSDARLSSSVF